MGPMENNGSGALEAFGADAEQVKASVAPARAEAKRQIIAAENEMAEARAEMERQRLAMEADFRRRKTELESRLAPLREQLQQLTEVAWTVDLYLGRDEEVQLLVDGDPAPADTPLTIRQNVLAADEESLVLIGKGGVDAESMDAFLAWISADPANRDRVVPDQRSVVAVVPTRRQRNYGSAGANAAMDAANAQTYWILRNGERLYVMTTDFIAKDRILPMESEFVTFFNTRRLGDAPGPMRPGSDEWIRAEKEADSRRRHFMRAMLILQGIVDRSVVFHPLPEGGLNLMSLKSQTSGKVRIINESDRVLTDGRESFHAWQHRLNSMVRPGHRVVLGRPEDGFEITPEHASAPPVNTPLNIAGRHPQGGLKITYARTDQVWRAYEEPVPDEPGYVYRGHRYAPAKSRASIRIWETSSSMLPFDLATTEDLEYYLNSRAARTDYINMVPVLRSALEARRAEEEAEAPLRRALVSTAMAEHGLDEDRAQAVVDEACTVFKTGSTWGRALHDDEAAASAGVLKQVRSILNSRNNAGRADMAVSAARELFGDNLLAVTMNRSGAFHAYAPANDMKAIHHGTAGYLTEVSLGTSGTPGKRRDWVRLAPRSLATRSVVFGAEAWKEWKHADPAIHLTGPEVKTMTDRLLDEGRRAGWRPITVVFDSFTDSGTPVQSIVFYGLDPEAAGSINSRIRVMEFVWNRTVGGDLDVKAQNRWSPRTWGRFSPPAGVPDSIPWSEETRFGPRPYRVWTDEAELEGIYAEQRAAQEAEREANVERARVGTIRIGMRKRAAAAWNAHVTAEARARFTEDYATDDQALWEHHLGTIRLPDLPQQVHHAINAAPVDAAGPLTIGDLPGASPVIETHPWLAAVRLDDVG